MRGLVQERLPQNAEPIYVEWPIKEGGICAYAWTDKKGEAYLCVKTLNRIGKVTGGPDWLRQNRFKSDVVVGFIDSRPLVVRARVMVTASGLELIVRLPPDAESARDFMERRFTPWGGNVPLFSLMIHPTNETYAVNSFPTK